MAENIVQFKPRLIDLQLLDCQFSAKIAIQATLTIFGTYYQSVRLPEDEG